VERFFAQAKGNHGLATARYRGLGKMKIQLMLTALAVNLKRMVTLLETCVQTT
jgi:IS5 family transposase